MAFITGIPLINGVAYTHANLSVVILGRIIVGVTAINYKDTQAITGNHSTGTKYTSVGFGPVETEGSITMTLEEVERLQAQASGGRIQNLPFFTIGVMFKRMDANALVRHSLKMIKLKGRGVQSETENTQIVEELPMFIGDIDYNAK